MSQLRIRPLTPADFSLADELLRAAYRRDASFLGNLRLNLLIEPGGWWAAEITGRLVGTVGAVNYGSLAYIGLMAVVPSHQRQGIGRQLMEHLLGQLRRAGCPRVLLDATPAGVPLYRALGFRGEYQSFAMTAPEQWTAPPTPSGSDSSPGPSQVATEPIGRRDLDELAQFDTPRFGADRRRLLAQLLDDAPEQAWLARDGQGRMAGYLFAREPVVGPWVAENRATAAALLHRASSVPYSSPPGVFVPRSNRVAVEVLEQAGFVVARSLEHMRLGPPLDFERPAELYGQTSYALG